MDAIFTFLTLSDWMLGKPGAAIYLLVQDHHKKTARNGGFFVSGVMPVIRQPRNWIKRRQA